MSQLQDDSMNARKCTQASAVTVLVALFKKASFINDNQYCSFTHPKRRFWNADSLLNEKLDEIFVWGA